MTLPISQVEQNQELSSPNYLLSVLNGLSFKPRASARAYQVYPPVCPVLPLLSSGPNLFRKNGKDMYILSELLRKGSAQSRSGQLSLFEALSVAPDRNSDDLAESQAGLFNQTVKNLDVAFTKVNCGLSDNFLHEAPEGVNCQNYQPLDIGVTRTVAGCSHFDSASLSQIPDSVKSLNSTGYALVECEITAFPRDAKALLHAALDWLLDPSKGKSLADRVMARLIQAEAHETNPHLRSDYRQAFICLSLANKGNTEPFTASSYQMYGLHPDKVFPAIMARRKAMLAREFQFWYDDAGLRKPDVPKKGSAPTRDVQPNERIAALLSLPSLPASAEGTGAATTDPQSPKAASVLTFKKGQTA